MVWLDRYNLHKYILLLLDYELTNRLIGIKSRFIYTLFCATLRIWIWAWMYEE